MPIKQEDGPERESSLLDMHFDRFQVSKLRLYSTALRVLTA